MRKDLVQGSTFPDFELPDQDGTARRLSELQGDDPMILMLGHGEHCPRERQHQREMVKFHQRCAVAFTQLVTVLPNNLHDVYKLRISTGAYWTYLADADLELQRALEIEEYTDPHHDATVPHTIVLAPGLIIDKDLRGVLVLGTPIALSALGGPAGPAPSHQIGFRPDGSRAASRMGSEPAVGRRDSALNYSVRCLDRWLTSPDRQSRWVVFSFTPRRSGRNLDYRVVHGSESHRSTSNLRWGAAIQACAKRVEESWAEHAS